MLALLQKFSLACIGLFVLSSFTLVKQTNQKDTGLLATDTISIVQDSLLIKDTLWVKYKRKEIKSKIVSDRPYKEWLNKYRLNLKDVPATSEVCPIETLKRSKRR